MKNFLSILLCFAITGCATNTGNLAHDRRAAVANVLMTKAAKVLGQFAVVSLSSAAQKEQSGGKVDWQSTLASAAWAQANTIVTAQDFTDVMNAATMNEVPNTVAAAAAQLTAAQLAGIPSNAAMNAIANTVSANALNTATVKIASAP